jgi:pyruvate dehydrogenase (quinone)
VCEQTQFVTLADDATQGARRVSWHTMTMNVSDFIVRRLSEWGVTRIFGYSGDGINGILGALGRANNTPELIQPPHEELCALMATGHAKFTGQVGVCLATQGPGAIHLLNGLYDARLDHQPVVAIIGQQSQMSMGAHYQQEVDLLTLFKDVAGEYVQMVTTPEQVRHVIDRAFRTAMSQRTVTCVIVPHDLQAEDAIEQPPHEHGAILSAVGWSRPRVLPTDADLRRAADVLNAGEKIAILVGAGALNATDEVIAVAEQLGAGVAKALLGKAAVPDDVPFVTGSVGWLGTRASNEMLAACDTLLMVGSGFPYTEFMPKEGQARGVQIDIDGRMLSMRYPMEVNLTGDSAETLSALLPLLKKKQHGTWRTRIEDSIKAWRRELHEHAMTPADPINPQRVFSELSSRLPDNCIITADSGSSTVWYARHLQLRRGMMASGSGTLATMGSAVPYALAAKFAYPDRLVIATSGDGAMQMIGLNALQTIGQHWRRWLDPRLIVLMLNNRELSYVTWEQRVMEGDPKFAPSQDIPDLPYAKMAELYGLKGIRVDHPDQIGPAWDEALAADRPVLIEAVTDPTVPTLPPELQQAQREKIEAALSQGDPDADRVRERLRQESGAGKTGR